MTKKRVLEDMDIEATARAIEEDEGFEIPDLRQGLAEAKARIAAVVHTPEQIEARKRGRPAGSVKADSKVQCTLRIDPDVLAALKATGTGWQTRVNAALRASVLPTKQRRA